MRANSNPSGLFAALLALFVLFVSAVLYEGGFISEKTYNEIIGALNPGISEEYDYSVHFIDVGQAECILIRTPEKNVLIDAGDVGSEKTIKNYLYTVGIRRIDIFIVTHPHSDHIGSAAGIIKSFPIGEVIMPKIPSEYLPTSSVFEDFLRALDKKGCKVSYAKPKTVFELGEGKLEILSPSGDMGDNLNNYSVASKFTFGETSFLFTGDMESSAEKSLVDSGADISCTVLSAGHHGSSTSNSEEFLDAANPQYAAISCGFNNDYGHPHREVLSAFKNRGIKYYRTDFESHIVFYTDGKTITVKTAK
ncbi:MAG: MBL fold metallo-hydrolase [Oscillospiraceae bacterium]|nr:MBL fold metallo-hydrolase [Oscillospiraceae bacterium]